MRLDITGFAAQILLEELYLLVKTLNMNDDNEEIGYVISTNFIRKLVDLFFVIIGEKNQQIFP